MFLVVTYFENRSDYKRSIPSKHLRYTPSVTIIVPAWNESKTLTGTVESLLSLDYPKNKLEIFIVDDGSRDDTLSIANQYSKNPQVKIFHKENGGKYTALNHGIENSTSELIGCLDADSFVDSAALKAIVPHFNDKKVMAVTPSVQIYKPNNFLSKIQSVEYMIGEFTRKTFSKFDGLYVTPGPFSFYRRSVFKKIGGFKLAFNAEDMEMALRMQSHGMKITNAQDAIVYTVSPSNFRSLYKQRVRWTSGFLKNAFFSYRHMFFNPKYGELGMLVLPVAFCSIFIALFFTFFWFYSILKEGYDLIVQWSIVPPNFNFEKFPSLDWFTVNTEISRVLLCVLFCISIFFIIRGVKITKGYFKMSRDIIYFLCLYSFLAPFWLAKSVYNLITSKNADWR